MPFARLCIRLFWSDLGVLKVFCKHVEVKNGQFNLLYKIPQTSNMFSTSTSLNPDTSIPDLTGYEIQFSTNVIGPALSTQLPVLPPLLQLTAHLNAEPQRASSLSPQRPRLELELRVPDIYPTRSRR